MKFSKPLQPGKLIRRYKRFLADVALPDTRQITVHCPNSGSMRGCSTPGSDVMISVSDNPKRKYRHTLEMVKVESTWIGVNTSLTNHIVSEAISLRVISEFGVVDQIQREVKTSAHTRLDFLLKKGGRKIYVEVKNCSLVEDGIAMFPDAVTKRGAKHLTELLSLKKEGHNAAVFFCVQRQDASAFTAAKHIDPEYADLLKRVHRQGVMVLAYEAMVTPFGIEIVHSLPVRL